MTTRRKGLLLVLVVVPLSGIAAIGPVELILWAVLLVAWVLAFVLWGGRASHPTPAK
jgi:hypothetical protein